MTKILRPSLVAQKPLKRSRSIFIVLGFVTALSSSASVAQPCFSSAQCAQVRANNERLLADQQAAQVAAEAARARQAREAAKEAAKERVRQADARRQEQIEQDRAQAVRQAELLQAESEAKQRAQQAALLQAQQQIDLERLRAQRQVDQAQAQAAAEQRAREAAIIRERQQAEQQAAYEEQKRRKIIEEENRAAAQLAAEKSPDNHCHDRKTAGDLIDFFNGLSSASDIGSRAVDIDHLTTIHFDSANQAMSCHGVFVLQSGISLPGVLTTRLNVAGRTLTEFHRD